MCAFGATMAIDPASISQRSCTIEAGNDFILRARLSFRQPLEGAEDFDGEGEDDGV